MPTKTCSRCGIEKPLKSFPKAPRGKDGRRTYCHRCHTQRHVDKRRSPEDFEITVDESSETIVDPVIDAVFAFPDPILGPNPERVAELQRSTSKRYLITAAQNATPVHKGFWSALRMAAMWLDAQILVIPLRYKNPTSQWTTQQEDHDWWAKEVRSFLFNARKELNPNLVLCGDVKTQPTASNPLGGFESLTGGESCIIGHTKMQFRSVPVPAGRMPKILSTSGACTVPNFTPTKSGALGEFHHYLGAVLVEIDGDRFHLRQLNADREDGSFIDLDRVYTASSVGPAGPALGLVLGDAHAKFFDPVVDTATFGAGGMVEALNPQTVVFHDLIDGFTVNPHHRDNPFIAQAKFKARAGGVREEVEHAIEFVKEKSAGRKAVIVSSNHDDFLARWVVSHDWKRDPSNASFYLETALAVLKSAELTRSGVAYEDAFGYWVERLKGTADIWRLGLDESFTLGGNECGSHGERGPNGARGTIKNLARLGTKMIVGHAHSPGIEEGCYQTGTSTPLRLDYNRGPSSWLNTHVVVYANGARALLTIVDGTWKL